jgi:hypothetical protein
MHCIRSVRPFKICYTAQRCWVFGVGCLPKHHCPHQRPLGRLGIETELESRLEILSQRSNCDRKLCCSSIFLGESGAGSFTESRLETLLSQRSDCDRTLSCDRKLSCRSICLVESRAESFTIVTSFSLKEYSARRLARKPCIGVTIVEAMLVQVAC